MSELIRDSKYRRLGIVVVAVNDKDKLVFKFAETEALEHALTSDIAACECKSSRKSFETRNIRLALTYSIFNSNLYPNSLFDHS